MNFLGAYASQTSQSSANPFALFAVAQSPRETIESYRAAREYSYTEFEILTGGQTRTVRLGSNASSVESEKSTSSSSSKRSWLARRRDAVKQLF
ncbi:hypothetical protein CTheo_6543 [Ceratobasidium theobromae]|uniref:Uncharacterized protein n=1 Tax=Ceratobasidium theobromae TaxID=1582974 RepID=A0A5N5QEX9_9AGAM|nr:hypothetical protein CTheo_6543 [Ceratobasidium theobromae]